MPVLNQFIVLQINNEDVVCIDINHFVTNNDILWSILFKHDVHITRPNIKFVWPADQIFGFCFGIILIKGQQIEAKFSIFFIGQYVEFIFEGNDVLNSRDTLLYINVYGLKLLIFDITIEDILIGRNNKFVLSIVENTTNRSWI